MPEAAPAKKARILTLALIKCFTAFPGSISVMVTSAVYSSNEYIIIPQNILFSNSKNSNLVIFVSSQHDYL